MAKQTKKTTKKPAQAGKKSPKKADNNKKPFDFNKRTTDKLGDVLVNQAGVKFVITAEKLATIKGYNPEGYQTRVLELSMVGSKQVFELNENSLKYSRDKKILVREKKGQKSHGKK